MIEVSNFGQKFHKFVIDFVVEIQAEIWEYYFP